RPQRMWRALRPKNMARESVVFLCMQTAPQPLRMVWKRRRWWPFSRTLATEGAPIPASIPAASDFTFRAAQQHGGEAFACLSDVFLNIPATAHCMGGAALADSPTQGVCDRDHRVFGYQNLYIIDGSNISTNLGVNPSLTIAAMAEAAVGRMPPKYPAGAADAA
ncbi:GMC oxidoreductase, partial [Neisseria shayeganii]